MGELSFRNQMPGWPGHEQGYAAPFSVVNAAVFHVLTIWAAQRPVQLPREETAGAVRYTIALKHNSFMLYVLDRGERQAAVRVHAIIPRGIFVPSEEDIQSLINVLAWCAREITEAIRYTYPEYTHVPLEITPPPPRWEDDPEAVLNWRRIYAAKMTDKELAERLGIAASTLSNYVSTRGQKRTARGRPKKQS